MTVAVRYYSRSGKTRTVAETIVEAIGTKVISVDAPDATLTQSVDVLFIGGALYAYGLDRNLATYLDTLDAHKVGRAVLFSTSWLSKHALDLMRKSLEAKDIAVSDETLYLKSGAVEMSRNRVVEFAKRLVA